jgi:crotonobetainyl-CoA:carnitine CoA-transferase CaiB-like acyl-CoA transferase
VLVERTEQAVDARPGPRDAGPSFLHLAWAALGGAPLPPDALQVSGRSGLVSPLAVEDLAVGAVAAQLLAARELTGRTDPVRLDAAAVGFAFRSERYARQDGRPAGAGFAPLSRFWPTADGWVRLHANYPHHRAAVLRVLGTADPGAAAAGWRAEELESAVVEAGGAAAAVRTAAGWAAHPQGRAVAGLPLLGLARVADGPPRDVPLAGLRILDLTRVIAGPVATRTLASHGADVLRLDSPRLPDDPAGLVDTGPGKRSAVVDLASRTGRATLEELLRGADVVVQGYRPGALDAFGLAPADLAGRHPHLAVVRVRAWGPAGPWQQRRGFDSLVQAATGIADTLGTDAGPGVLPAQALDHGTGHLAAAAVLRAVAERRAQGGVWHAELSLAQVAQWLLTTGRRPVPEEGERDQGEADVTPYLVELPSPTGPVTLVGPPGSPVWRTGPHLAGADAPTWPDR